MNNDELDKLKHAVAGMRLPNISKELQATLDATKMLPAMQTRRIALEHLVSPEWIDAARKISESLKPMAAWVNEHRSEINSLAGSIRNANLVINQTLLDVGKQWEQSLGPMLQSWERFYRAYRERLQSYPNLAPRVESLAKRGWFVSTYFGLSEIDQVAALTDADNQILDKFIEQAYRDSLEEHTRQILQRYPEREFAIRPALNAHLRGEYALSVPVFFAQADGICASTVGKHLFRGKPGGEGHISSLAADQVAKLEEGEERESLDIFTLLHLALWAPLVEQQPIAYNPTKRDEQDYRGLNRHTVLHGESFDYATEINSLKAFSLLSYVASLLATTTQDDELEDEALG